MVNQMKMVDDRVDYRKCAWYHGGLGRIGVCGCFGYDECNDEQARNCKWNKIYRL